MSQSRQLAAIMFTDIVGYTALMGRDEQKAFEVLRMSREMQSPVVEQFNGRWIKELGDGVMTSFGTVSDAVGAAVKIQENCRAAGEFELRIGIHLGEVVFENDDVFGDGVNIASRIQSVARPGTIYVSESVHHNISNKKGIRAKFIGQEHLKNVKEPIGIYEIMITDDAHPAIDHVMHASHRNSIAILPFANMSSDPEQEYFSDGLTEEIIADLSKVGQLLVISRSSIMTLKGTQKRMKEIAGELNVRYVLEGSVRKAANNLRITAQLIDAENDSHVWAEKYSGSLEDVFDIQEKVSRSIVDALRLKLTPEEDHLIAERPIANVHAYECFLKARQEMFRGSREAMEHSLQLIQNGLDLVGPNDLLYASLGYTYYFYFRFIDKSDVSYLLKAKEFAAKSFELNRESSLANVLTGWIQMTEGNLQESARSMKRALIADPSNYDALLGYAETCIYAGKSVATYDIALKLVEIDPLTPMSHIMRGSFLLDSDMEQGLPFFRKAYLLDPKSPITQWMLASALFWCGRNEEAYPLVDRLADTAPDWTFTHQLLFLSYGLRGDKERALLHATSDMQAEAKDDRHLAFHLAECYAVIGEKEKALDFLEHAIEIFFPRFLAVDRLFANIRDEVRFHDLINRALKQSDEFEV